MIINKNEINKRFNEKQKSLPQYAIPDGTHYGTIKTTEYVKETDRLYITAELTGEEEGTTYKFSAKLADFAVEPLSKIFDPFMNDNDDFETDDLIDHYAQFSTRQKKSKKDGKYYSNVTEWDYVEDDDGFDE